MPYRPPTKRQKSIIAAILTAFVLLAGCAGLLGSPAIPRSLPDFEAAVLPLYAIEPTVKVRHRICTTWPLGERYWVTADHCVRHGRPLEIAGEAAPVVYRSRKWDLAILHGPAHRGLALSPKAPRFEERAILAGYPGVSRLRIFFGQIANPNGCGYYTKLWQCNLVIQGAGGPGMSGGPIFNARRQVISLVQGAYTYTASVHVLGVPYERLMELTKAYRSGPIAAPPG